MKSLSDVVNDSEDCSGVIFSTPSIKHCQGRPGRTLAAIYAFSTCSYVKQVALKKQCYERVGTNKWGRP